MQPLDAGPQAGGGDGSDQSPFAAGLTLDEARAAVAGRREFRETVKGSLLVLGYDFCFGATFPDPAEPGLDAAERRLRLVRLECRGIVFHAATGQLLCRRLHKFMNLDQSEQSASHRLNLHSHPHVCVEKMDGCMMSGLVVDGQAVLVSKNGPTELSRAVEAQCDAAGVQWRALVLQWAERGYSVTFEWVSPDNVIVLEYPQPQLVLIAIRHNHSGRYVAHDEMAAVAAGLGLQTPRLLWHSGRQGVLELPQLVQRIKAEQGLEGCVLKLEDVHHWYKIKSDWYFAQSRSHLQLPSSERQLWAALLEGTMDDVLPRLTAEDAFSHQLFAAVQAVVDAWSARIAALAPSTHTAKQWAQLVVQHTADGSIARSLFYKAHSLQPSEHVAAVLTMMARQCTAKGFATMRLEMQLAHVNFYPAATE